MALDPAIILSFNRTLGQFIKVLINRFAVRYEVSLYRLAIELCVGITTRSMDSLIDLYSTVIERSVQSVQSARFRERLRTVTPMLTYFDVYGDAYKTTSMCKPDTEMRDLIIEEVILKTAL